MKKKIVVTVWLGSFLVFLYYCWKAEYQPANTI